jgi:type IV pilus assembly protein PilY1
MTGWWLRAVHCALVMLAVQLLTADCRADTDEAWLQRAELPHEVRPLLAIVLDRSAATARMVEVTEDYDPARDYGGGPCEPGKLYFRQGPGPAPDCVHQAGVDIAARDSITGLHCDAARTSLAKYGYFVASRAAQWRGSDGGGFWDAPRTDSGAALECRADRGLHGESGGTWYASDGGGAPWTGTAEGEIAWDRPPFADAYVLYVGNYLNYLRTVGQPIERSIADTLTGQLARALSATADLDVALLRVDDDGPDGGFVARAPVPAATAAADLLALSTGEPIGSAPLAETLTEAASWLAGRPRRFGLDDRTDPAATDPFAPASYRSPFAHACRPISLAFATAGEASGDESAAAAANEMPQFEAETGGCGNDCLAQLAGWLGQTDLLPALPGVQSAPVSWLLPPSVAAPNEASLTDPLAYVNLVAGAFQRDAAVAGGPQLSAAALTAFDSSIGAPGVVFGLTAPRARERWLGNFLRYAFRAPGGPLEPPLVVDRDGDAAISDDGLPGAGTRSLWSDVPDANLLAGGAAGRLPAAEARRIHTNLAGDRLLDDANRLTPGNARIGREALGLAEGDPRSPDALLAWLEAQRTLGDPGLHAPAIAEYPEAGLRIVYAATQDGLLHAFDAESGVELWAWMPAELLPRISALEQDLQTAARSHGIDGPLLLHRHDPDGDGRIIAASGEHLWLVFGLGRGGARYYALDVSAPRDPRLLWSLVLPDAGVSGLAEPVITRLSISGSGQSADEWVVFLAGGYDWRFDARGVSDTGVGNRLLLADAVTGRILWSAGPGDGDLAVPGLASLAGAPRALDMSGDGELDRAYALDVSGGLWRFDFAPGRTAGELATARRIARLGTSAHRFQSAPDVSIVRFAGRDRLAVAAGSGWVTRPRDATVEDRLYVVFDDAPAAEARELADGDLFDATEATSALPPDAPGWYFRLAAHGAGEKVAGPAVTFDGVLRFQTYQPLPLDASAPCGPPRAVSRRYSIEVATALPFETAEESEEDEPEEIEVAGLPPGLRFGFPGRWDETCEGCKPRPFGILSGETFDAGYGGDPVRTSWRKLVPPASP